MTNVERKQETRASDQGQEQQFLNYDLSKITFHYQNCVVWLFQKIQNLMVDQKLETVCPLLYYSKSLLDFHIKNMTKLPLSFLRVIKDSLNFVFEIFVHKIENLEIGSLFSKLVIPPSSVQLSVHYPLFSSMLNPFKMLNKIEEDQPKEKRLAVYHLMTLALTIKQFKNTSPKMILFGCFNPMHKRKGWNFKFPLMCPQALLELKACENLYQWLLQSIQHWDLDASN